MAVPGLKNFNKLLASAKTEVESWSRSSAAANVPPEGIEYLLDLLGAIQGSVHVGSIRASLELALSTTESFGVPVSDIAPSLVRLSQLLEEREHKQKPEN